MGKQSSRLIYQGTDIKDLYYQGKQLFKLYKGNNLVWEKLGDYCLPTTALRIFDLYTNEWERGSECVLYTMTTNANHVIAVLMKDAEKYFAISKSLTEWKIISEVEYDSSSFKGFGKKDSGFYIYTKDMIYSIDIEFGLDYQVSVIDISDYRIAWFSIPYGISDYAYLLYIEGSKYGLMKVSADGTIEKGILGYPINPIGQLIDSMSLLVVSDENVFLNTLYRGVSGTENIIYKIINMDTDTLYTMYRKNTSVSNIDIIYDNYQTALFIHDANLTQFAYYRIDPMGKFLKISEKEGNGIKQITMPLYGIGEYGLIDITGHPAIPSELTIEITIAEQYKTTSEYIAEGAYPYSRLDFYTASHSSSESLYVDNDIYSKECIICTTKTFDVIYNAENLTKQATKRILIFLDNLFWEESENNYAVLIDS